MIYILADGNGQRWGNYLGVPKELITIDGETLLDRILRQLKGQDVTIIGDYERGVKKEKYNAPDKRILFQMIAERHKEPFILLNADCYYTDEIIEDCLTRDCERWLHWCCPHPNYYTGKPWGEGYIHKVTDWEWWITKLKEYNRLVDSHKLSIGNDWIINRYLYGRSDLVTHSENIHDLSEYDVYWHDETDDFDYPIDYDRFITWTKRR